MCVTKLSRDEYIEKLKENIELNRAFQVDAMNKYTKLYGIVESLPDGYTKSYLKNLAQDQINVSEKWRVAANDLDQILRSL
jgi:hypothetical protein